MKLALTREARAIALAAADRGFLTPKQVWEAACQWSLGGASSPRELYLDLLSAEQLDEVTQDDTPSAEGANVEATSGSAAPAAAEGR